MTPFAKVPKALYARHITDSARSLFGFLYLRATWTEPYTVTVSYTTISQELGWGRTKISNALRVLEAEGAITKHRQFNEATIYTLNGLDASSPKTGLTAEMHSSRPGTDTGPETGLTEVPKPDAKRQTYKTSDSSSEGRAPRSEAKVISEVQKTSCPSLDELTPHQRKQLKEVKVALAYLGKPNPWTDQQLLEQTPDIWL